MKRKAKSYSIEDENPEMGGNQPIGGNDIFCMKTKVTILVCIFQNFVVYFIFFLCEAPSFLVGEKKLHPEADCCHSDVKCPQIPGDTV